MVAGGDDYFDMRDLARLTSWGVGAALALVLAVMTGLSPTGTQRANVALATWSGQGDALTQLAGARIIPRSSDSESETRRLNDAVRLLAADRDRLLTRVGSIERNLDDMTGSIKRQAKPAVSANAVSSALPQMASVGPAMAFAARAAAMPPIKPPSAGPFARPVWMPLWTANIPAPWPSLFLAIPTPMPTPAATGDPAPTGSIGADEEFGVDIGGASGLDGLKLLWNARKNHYPALLEGLRPVISIRESKSGETDLRLIVGPLASSAAAARLCDSFDAADIACETTAFEGQRPAW